MITFVALATGLGVMLRTIAFGKLGENLTYSIRNILYLNILEKNIGFHDDRENNTRVLSSTMAIDSVDYFYGCTEYVVIYLEVFFALMTGLVFGFYFCW